ncbi:glycosyl transferase [Frankia sp. AgB1.9]|uniref:glycosyltransferase family 2 protein n=1 Tax=unclassified Frankia TaxID=2632575 RepID=UPI0019346729|nr:MULTISPECIES: glycosyl transferase [unclassified Frankia]MBL7489597.1 glycosyl transferase [Frankia sp. AgW1.1]MBL7547304.1 glycosyl transferase [Frankia sp. AgB1.9]MBL7618703.1 glycosyl transferase [Frankia sp. AgB1.8]
MNKVEAVVINWKRPGNVERIVDALQAQSVPCTVTVCDTHLDDQYTLSQATLSGADRVYRWGHNTGPYSRFVPLAAYDHEYTFFVDDDMLPGARCVEHFVNTAESLPGFGSIGQMGRIVPSDGVYTARNVGRLPKAREIDILVRGFFVRTRNLHHIAQLRWLMNYMAEQVPEDDMLLCVAMRLCAGLRNYLTPNDPDPETLMNRSELPDPHALHRRPDHIQRRIDFMLAARAIGWLSVSPPPSIPKQLTAADLNGASGDGLRHRRDEASVEQLSASPLDVSLNGHSLNGHGPAAQNGLATQNGKPARQGARPSKPGANRGVVYLALGESYANLVTDSARTLRLHGYDGPVRVITDAPSHELVDLECETLVVGSLPGGFASRFHKTQLNRWSFERTLFLDADTIVISSIDEVWELLAGRDMAMAPDMHSSVADVIARSVNDPNRRAPEYQLMQELGLSDRRYYNSGVMLWDQNGRVSRMFNRWHQEWNRFGGEDQLALVRAIAATGTKVSTLDSAWNRRPKAFSSVDEARGAGVRILHFLSRQRSLLNDAYLGVVAEYLG